MIIHQDNHPSLPVLIQGAMDIEVDLLVAALAQRKELNIATWTYWTGNINSYPVIVSRTEIGLVSAAAATAYAISHFSPRCIINQGTAGGHDPALQRGDVVIGERTLNIGAYKMPLTDAGKGVHPEQWEHWDAPMKIRRHQQRIPYSFFYADKNMLALVSKVSPLYPHGKVVIGTIGTSDQWNREIDRINWLHQTYGTSVEEMETSAVAQLAHASNLPFISIRVVSNTDLHQQEFLSETATHCQQFVLDYVNCLVQHFQG